MKIIGDTLILDSGKEFYVNGGIVGLDPEGRCLYGGYDDCHQNLNYLVDEVLINDQEWNEICDYMSNAWMKAKKEDAMEVFCQDQ